jgi:NitT/TauT family transport system substrate-binding protein
MANGGDMLSSGLSATRRSVLAALVLAAPLCFAQSARAEVAEVTLSQQFGLAFLPIMVMENQKFVEKQLATRGLPGTKATFTKMAGPSVMVDAMLAGALHFAAQGPPSLALLWDRTKGSVRGIGGICTYDLWLNTRNTAVTSIKDLTEKDRIAVPSVKVSTQAILLQMLAEREFGVGQHNKLDPLTLALGHPDAMAAVLNPVGEVNAHFASSPFHETEMKAGLKTLTTAFAINGGQSSQLLFTTTEKFRTENPKTYEAVVAAFEEALAWINADKRRAVKLYIDVSGDKKTTEEEALAMVTSPGFEYTRTPMKVGKLFDFMARVGTIKTKPASWRDLFFPDVHALPGD